MNLPGRNAYYREQRQLAQRLLDEARGADGHHQMALEALLMAYMSLASYHTCCTEGAAHALISQAYQLLDQVNARPQAPPATPTRLH